MVSCHEHHIYFSYTQPNPAITLAKNTDGWLNQTRYTVALPTHVFLTPLSKIDTKVSMALRYKSTNEKLPFRLVDLAPLVAGHM